MKKYISDFNAFIAKYVYKGNVKWTVERSEIFNYSMYIFCFLMYPYWRIINQSVLLIINLTVIQ